MDVRWYQQDREAVPAALARGERPDLTTTLSAGVVDELVALHEELGVFDVLDSVLLDWEPAQIPSATRSAP